MPIINLDDNTRKLITTTQIITSVCGAVKELVENAFDANAQNIEINLVNNGTTLIEVKDDGDGIPNEDASYLALPSCTSKISSFEDLGRLQTYGFRGEALNALCNTADVIVMTKTDKDEVGRLYNMSNNGNIKTTELYPKLRGTTVQVKQIFKHFPVRRKIITNTKKANQDIKLIETLLKSFGICNPTVRIHYRVNNNIIFMKPNLGSIKEAAEYVLGKKVISNMKWLSYEGAEATIQFMIPDKEIQDVNEICQTNHHYIFVNKRPVKYKDIEKVVNDIILEYFDQKLPARKKPIFLLHILVDPMDIDVNLEPNKDVILFTNKQQILDVITKHLTNFYGIQMGTETIKDVNDIKDELQAITNYVNTTSSSHNSSTHNVNVNCMNHDKLVYDSINNPNNTVRIDDSLLHDLNSTDETSNIQAIKNTSDNQTDDFSENVSQIPEVDLGEDFELDLILNKNSNVNTYTDKMNDTQHNKGNKLNIKDNYLLETWSKGHIEGLKGGTNVRPCTGLMNDISLSNDSSTMETTFTKFVKDARAEIIKENPKLSAVQVARKITDLWKHLPSQEHGYYQDLVREERAYKEKEKTEIKKKLHTDTNKNGKRLLRMLENMKNRNTKKSENLVMRTIVPWDVNIDKITTSFKNGNDYNHTDCVVGSVSVNFWIIRNSAQLWILNICHILKGLNITDLSIDKMQSKDVEKLFKQWIMENKDMSMIVPIYTLP
ncbi:hypothetical protein KPH14_007673 [Odynerus spinipes]|uniref:HMG box domain-containing protein n=1 Tax=Odynerus spinipes TaxID=1348599 RepID=A0AAD9RIW6_9HYME|nr:hypothetical protein KPH14_007673 [Odynerus spinipes]